jgi:hypothetical protein
MGWSLGEGEALERFKGRSAEQDEAELEAQPGRTLPETLALCDACCRRLCESELCPVEGAGGRFARPL